MTVRFLVRTVRSIQGVLPNVYEHNLQLSGQLDPQAALTPAQIFPSSLSVGG